MTKSSNTERAKRVNMAINLLKKSGSLSEAAKTLSSLYGISKRQAYRYVKEAESASNRIPVPAPSYLLRSRSHLSVTGQYLSA